MSIVTLELHLEVSEVGIRGNVTCTETLLSPVDALLFDVERLLGTYVLRLKRFQGDPLETGVSGAFLSLGQGQDWVLRDALTSYSQIL